MSKASEKRELALELYIYTDLEQKQICDIVGWSEKAFTTNKQKYGWEELKKARTVTSDQIIKNLYTRAFELSEEKDGLDPDKIVKLAASIEKLSNKKVTTAQIINVFKQFTSYMLRIDPELAKKINSHQQQFVINKVNS